MFLNSTAAPAGTPPWQEDFDLEALGRLQGEEKEWVEYSLLNFLEKHNLRAIRASLYLKSQKPLSPFKRKPVKAETKSKVGLLMK